MHRSSIECLDLVVVVAIRLRLIVIAAPTNERLLLAR